jgi:hypothetical protein
MSRVVFFISKQLTCSSKAALIPFVFGLDSNNLRSQSCNHLPNLT